MATTNSFEVVSAPALKVGDKVKIIDLTDGKVSATASVSFVPASGTEFEVYDGVNHTYYGSTKVRNLVILREVVQLPKNWPPKQDDVWKIGDYVWHTLGSGTSLHFRKAGAASSNASMAAVLQNYGKGKAELLFRLP